MDLNNSGTLEFISDSAKKQINQYIENSTNACIRNKIDFIGFGNILYKKNPSYFNTYLYNWNDHIDDFNFKTDVKVKVLKQGNVFGGIKYETKVK